MVIPGRIMTATTNATIATTTMKRESLILYQISRIIDGIIRVDVDGASNIVVVVEVVGRVSQWRLVSG